MRAVPLVTVIDSQHPPILATETSSGVRSRKVGFYKGPLHTHSVKKGDFGSDET